MRLADARLVPAPGEGGLVCRTAGAVLYVADRTRPAAAADLIDRVRREEGEQPGRSLARSLAGLIAADDDNAVPPFALVASSAHGVAIMVYGGVDVDLQDDSGGQTLSAAGSLTWVDRELPGPFTTILAHRAGEAAPGIALDLDLSGGTVAADGFALTTLREATQAPVGEGIPGQPEPEPTPGPAPGPIEPEPSPAPAPIPPGPVPEPTPLPQPDPDPAPLVAGPPAGAAAEPAEPAEPVPEEPTRDQPPVEAPPVGVGESTVFRSPFAESVNPAPLPTVGADPAHDLSPGPPPGDVRDDPATLPPTAIDADFDSVLLGALDPDEPEDRGPLPVEPDPSEVREPEQSTTSEIEVMGVVCSRGHFNDPRSRFCSSCGISMVQQTGILRQGPRPPLGVLVFEDGATFSLSSDYVIGRQPESSDLVAGGDALPLQVDDPERSISRAHAEVRLVEWDVHLVNLSQTNGSFVWDATSNQWIPIPVGQSVVLQPGWRIALGRRSAVFESSLVR